MGPRSIEIIGKTCLITGANSGLGKAIAIDMASRGATVIMACRKMYHEAQAEIIERSGNADVALRVVDLSSLLSVVEFCDGLREDGVHLDLVFFNAGMASSANALSRDGFSLLWQVNYLSNALMVMRMLRDGVIPNNVFLKTKGQAVFTPRLIFTSSSRHRKKFDVDLENFGKLNDFRVRDTLRWYGWSKLYLMTFIWELGRRLNLGGKPDVSVHSFCPGPFRSRIGRGAGWIGRLAISLMPTSAEKAAYPAIHLATASDLEGKTLQYMHKRVFEQPDERVLDAVLSAELWDETLRLFAELGY